MVTLEQVEQLDERVRKVIGLIESLRHENARLCAENRRLLEENQRLEYHLQESERRSLALSGAQEMLEKGLMGAIDRLDSVSSGENPSAADGDSGMPSVKVSPDKASNSAEDDPTAGLEALLVQDPVAEEALKEGARNNPDEAEPHREERKMDIF